MKPIKTLLTILFILLLSSPSWSVTLGDLVERDGLYYEKFTDIPFTADLHLDGSTLAMLAFLEAYPCK